MLSENAAPAAATEGCAWLRPWRVLLMGLAAVVAGSALTVYDGPTVTPLRLLLMIAGLIAGGWAVKQQLTTAGQEVDERVESAGLVAVYAFTGLVGYLGMAEAWFSGKIFFAFFIVVTIVGSLLVLLPRVWRRLVATVLILLHFGGIVVAVNCMPATNGQVPWLPMMLNAKFYRPYLSGLYLSNAYHFYAPDPGASTLVWLRIQYKDGSHRWLKLPNRPDSETPLHYQREMGISEVTSSPSFRPITPAEFKEKLARREQAGDPIHADIPLLPDRMPAQQYSELGEGPRKVIESMVRHVCRYYPHPTDPSIPPESVKVYRLTYAIIMPPALLQGRDPTSDDLKTPFYMGEYDTEGHRLRYDKITLQPLPPERAEEGEDSPFLYWAIPMDCLARHSGDAKEGEGQQ